jgi:UDP-N-acetylmuramate dehydrogenase
MDFSDFQTNVPLASFTTTHIGGPAEYLAVATKQSQFFSLLKFLHLHPDLPYTILGLGSNVIISDSGLPGLTIINKASGIKVLPKLINPPQKFITTDTQRKENEPEKYLDFSKIDYDESGFPTQEVLIQAGTPLPFAINQLFSLGLTGLQWFSYIPGTIGGAVYQNIHGGKYHFSDYLVSVKVFDLKTGKTKLLKKEALDWKYESSFFQSQPNLVILAARLRLFKGDTELAKKVSAAWIAQKTLVQPMNSPGSAFANPSLEICQKLWGEQKSTGWIIDHELNLKGFAIGDAQISLQHSNFIVNRGHATAADYLALIQHVQKLVRDRFGFELIPEVKFLGKF